VNHLGFRVWAYLQNFVIIVDIVHDRLIGSSRGVSYNLRISAETQGGCGGAGSSFACI
jgi:hypothetical protein